MRIERKINDLVEEFIDDYDGGNNEFYIEDEYNEIEVDELFMTVTAHDSISDIYRSGNRIYIEVNQYDLNETLREKIKEWSLDRDEEERMFSQTRFNIQY